MIPFLLAILSPAHAVDLDPIRVEGGGAVHVQAFGAPYVRSVQERRGYLIPTFQGEVEFRNDGFGVRLRAGLGPALLNLASGLQLAFDAGLLLLSHAEPLQPDGARYAGLELGAAFALAQPRLYAGPTLGTARRWDIGQVSGQVGLRATAALAYEPRNSDAWVTLSPGAALGAQIGVAVTFQPTE